MLIASFNCENLAAHIDGDFTRQVAVGHGDRHLGYIAHLGGQVAGHRVDALGEILPDAADAAHLRLAAELAVGADFARHAGDFGGEYRKLLDHRVDELGAGQKLAFERPAITIEGDGLRQIAFGNGAHRPRHLCGRRNQVVDQAIERGDLIGPTADQTG